MPPPEFLDHLRDHLIAQSLVRDPDLTTPDAPPLWLNPRHGVIAPGEGKGNEVHPTTVLGAFATGGIRARPYESALRQRTVDFQIRVSSADLAEGVHRDLRDELVDRRGWAMGTLRVEDSEEWRELQPLGSDEQSFDFVFAVIFRYRV